MRFLWFGKKKAAPAVEVEVVREPQEVYSVTGFICETNPMSGAKNTELRADTINSMILSVLSHASSPSDIAAQEFLQERGAIVLPTSDYSFSAERGFCARVSDEGVTRTVLLGSPEVIARATTPFCKDIAAAVSENPDCLVVAIDGIAYASFGITKELV